MKKLIILLLVFSQNLYSQDSSYLLRTVMGMQNFWIQKFQQNQISFNPPTINTFSIQKPLSSQCGVQKDPNFIYCFLNNNIYLSEDLYKSMAKEFDLPSIEFAIAHEYGHAVQKQLNKIQSTSMTREYQADCLSGIYMSRYSNKSVIDKSVYSFLYKYTEHSTSFNSLFDPQSHGDSESRFKAFKQGFETQDVKRCFDSYDLDYAIDGLTKTIVNAIAGNVNSESDIVGTWNVSHTQFTFNHDKTVKMIGYNGTIFNGTYEISGDQFYIRFVKNNIITEKVHTIVMLANDTFIVTATKNNVINSIGSLIESEDINISMTLKKIK